MNGEHKRVLGSAALDGIKPGREAMPPGAWRWIAIGQLWMLAGFAGLSLVVIAVLSFFHGGAGHGRDALLATALAGALLMALAWRGVTTVLQRAEGEDPGGPGLGTLQPARRRSGTSPRQAALPGIAPTS